MQYRGIILKKCCHCALGNLPTKPNDDGDGDPGGGDDSGDGDDGGDDGDADVVSGGDALLSVNTVGIINTLLCQYNSALLSRHRHLHHDFHPLSTHYVPFMAILIFAEFVIVLFWYATALCRSVKSTPKSV